MRRALTVLLSFVLCVATRAPAQELRIAGRVEDPAVSRLLELTGRGRYQILARDTVLPGTVVIDSDVVVLGHVRLEGTITGAVAVLRGGEFFLRPGGRVLGTVIEAGGGVYLSENASIGDRVELPATIATRVSRLGEEYTLEITPLNAVSRVQPSGLYGVGIPTYDRVNGLSLRAGVSARLHDDSVGPTLDATFLYHTARSAPGGEMVLTVPLRKRARILVEAARRPVTNDAWIRGDLANSLAAAFSKSDVRNYYESDIARVTVERTPPASLDVGQGFLAPRVRAAASTDRSLETRDPWSLFGGAWRTNPPIAPGLITSATAGATGGWRGLTSTFAAVADVEWAVPGLGDFEFGSLTADATWAMLAMWDHSIRVRGHLIQPLTGDVPPQRWGILGGPGTLPTLETGELRGDHLVYIESTYSIPVTAVTVPVVGSPTLVARHAVGSAWASERTSPPWRQNLGFGVAFPLIQAAVDIDPADPGSPAFSISASLPF